MALKKAEEIRAVVDRVLTPAVRARIAEVNRIVSDPAFQSALELIRRDVEELTALYEESPVAFVVDRLDMELGTRLLRADPLERDALMLALFEHALLERDHLELVEDAVRAAPVLDDPQAQDLLAALTMLQDRPVRWASACRLLLGGYEGALWLWAREERVVDDKRQMAKRTPGKAGHAKGVDRILEDDGVPLPDEHRRFVRQRVFDALANDIRHGRATVGHRECALVVLFAVDGWLDSVSGSQLVEDASERMNRLGAMDDDDAGPEPSHED